LPNGNQPFPVNSFLEEENIHYEGYFRFRCPKTRSFNLKRFELYEEVIERAKYLDQELRDVEVDMDSIIDGRDLDIKSLQDILGSVFKMTYLGYYPNVTLKL